MTHPIQFMLITPYPEIAKYIEARGVARIFMDRETLGKHERQANMGTPIYAHSFKQISAVKNVLSSAELLVRVNPINQESRVEIDRSIDAGADVLMLPFFTTPEEVEEFLHIVDGRAKTNILFESAQAVGRAEQILSIDGLQEVHFGLNDLRIGLNLDFLFESFAGGLIEWLCSLAKKYRLSYGIGGIGRVGKELLPAELIMKEHVRLGSQRIILSRVFHNESKTLAELEKFTDFSAEIQKLRKIEDIAHGRTPDEQERDRQLFCEKVALVANKIRESRQ